MLLENLVTQRVSEENASNSSLTRRVTKQGYLLLAALAGGQADSDFGSGSGLASQRCSDPYCWRSVLEKCLFSKNAFPPT